ncbi:MAG TPA: ATP-binding protein [Jatrophihabitans sp.]|jgi:signal transduction histidine kinase|uniref:sensor histidine kinase n=1 Tax=Jatrophihabitans sp. TaxID=1932789 RepID=UPI002E0C01E3|nr:ATP-binding protein [Jatrophihabitans sp.]
MDDTAAHPTPPEPRGSKHLVARLVAQFTVAGIVALIVVGVTTGLAASRIGTREAIAAARETTLTAQRVVRPVLAAGVRTGDTAALGQVDRVVRSAVLSSSLVRVKIWTRAGTILYSDEQRLIGQTYRLGADEQAAFGTGRIEADISDLRKPENRYERSQRKLLEVYLPITASDGTPLLFETYFKYDMVDASGRRLWRNFAPITLGALIVLELVQLPLAWSLARRLQVRMRERETLLRRTLQASDVERRHIAADLHDGVVQELTGVALHLQAAARRGRVEPADLDRSAEAVRRSIEGLRLLVVDLYPPDFADLTLHAALGDLLARATDRGVRTSLDVTLEHEPPDATARLLYRAAQEGVRNVAAHAGARSIRVSVRATAQRYVLEVRDDGRGFDEAATRTARREGHVGLLTLDGLVSGAGGRLAVSSRPGDGTTLTVELPR